MIHFLSMGVVLGLSAGFSPGPLLTLVISETLQHGMKAGIKVALAPLLTDLPIVVAAFYLLANLSSLPWIMGGVTIVGAAFVFFLGVKGLKSGGVERQAVATAPKSLIRGVLVNFLSPHPYLFWLTVGGPAVSRALSVEKAAAVAFVGGFYLLLVGSKISLAILVGRSRNLLQGKWYRMVLRFLGAALIVLAILLLRDGILMLRGLSQPSFAVG